MFVGNVRDVDHVEWVLSVLEANNEGVADLQVAGNDSYFWVEEVEACEGCKAVFKNCWVVLNLHQRNVVFRGERSRLDGLGVIT